MNKDFEFKVIGFDATAGGELELKIDVCSKGGKYLNYSEMQRWVEGKLNGLEPSAFDYTSYFTAARAYGKTDYLNRMLHLFRPQIAKVVFNDPATIVLWSDGTKTVVKAQGDEEKRDAYDPEKGLALAIAKKALGNQGNYYNEFDKWLNKEDE